MGGTKSVGPMWPHWENQLAKAKREGVIEGLERALRKVEEVGHLEAAASVSGLIEAEIERLRRGE